MIKKILSYKKRVSYRKKSEYKKVIELLEENSFNEKMSEEKYNKEELIKNMVIYKKKRVRTTAKRIED